MSGMIIINDDFMRTCSSCIRLPGFRICVKAIKSAASMHMRRKGCVASILLQYYRLYRVHG